MRRDRASACRSRGAKSTFRSGLLGRAAATAACKADCSRSILGQSFAYGGERVPLAAVAARRGPGDARASRGLLRDGHRRGTEAAQPLALYYSYMNLSKAFCLMRGARTTFDQAQHGLKERLREPRRELVDAYLVADPTSPNTAQNFDELLAALAGALLAARTNYDLPALLPQILSGHRLWAQAAGKVERRLAAKSKTRRSARLRLPVCRSIQLRRSNEERQSPSCMLPNTR
jgi:hypothetical protein